MPVKKPLVIISGPTCSGKTALGIEACESMPVSIISSDAGMIYQGMNIGTDKPSKEIREQHPHYLIDILTPRQGYSVAQFCHDTSASIKQIHDEHRVPIVLGGTMMYIQALLSNWFLKIKNEYDISAMVFTPFDKAALDIRVEQRFETMLESGLISESERLMEQYGMVEKLPSFKLVGYQQIFSYLRGDMSFAQMKTKAIIASRQLAKKQFTWLRNYEFGTVLSKQQIVDSLHQITEKGVE